MLNLINILYKAIYWADTLILNRKKDIQKEITKNHYKYLVHTYRRAYLLRSNKEIYKYTDINSDTRKRRIKLYGLIKRIKLSRLN